MVRTNTIVLAGMGAGVVRVKDTARALAISVDGNGRYCYLDPRRGAMLAVAEAARNVACRALDTPITGGNVSLYNETDGLAIYPTPVIGVVGLIEDASTVIARAFRNEGDAVVLLGEGTGELGGSECLKIVHEMIAGQPPQLDLSKEKALLTLMADAVSSRLVQSAHDCSDGGIAVTLAECAFDSGGIGATIDLTRDSSRDDAVLFGESASRVVVSVKESDMQALLRLAAKHGVPARVIGTTGGVRLKLSIEGRATIDIAVQEAQEIWSSAFERYFARRAA